MSSAFQISDEDVFNVLFRHGKAQSIDDAIVVTNFKYLTKHAAERIQEAALQGNELDEQTENALDEIENVLIDEANVLDRPKLFGMEGQPNWDTIQSLSDFDKAMSQHCLALIRATDDTLIISRGDDDTVVLVATTEPKNDIVEFQVSDGLPGDRSGSNDFFSFTAALANYKEIMNSGFFRFTRSRGIVSESKKSQSQI
jgi:hypothetical protein